MKLFSSVPNPFVSDCATLYNSCIKSITALQSNKYFGSKILFGKKMAHRACASGDAPYQPEGIFQLIDKLEKIPDQLVQE